MLEKPPSPEPILEKPLPPTPPEQEKQPLVLKAVPFNPYTVKEILEPPSVKESAPITIEPPVAQKPQSHYDTIMRFAAVEFEGTIG